MRKLSKRISKAMNILAIVLELVCEIVLLPFHVINTIRNILKELQS